LGGYGVEGDAVVLFAGLLFGLLLGFDAGFAEGEVGFDVFVGEGRVEWGGDLICEGGVLVDEVEAGEFALLLVGVVAARLGDRRFGGWVGLGRSEMRGFFPFGRLRVRMTILGGRAVRGGRAVLSGRAILGGRAILSGRAVLGGYSQGRQ